MRSGYVYRYLFIVLLFVLRVVVIHYVERDHTNCMVVYIICASDRDCFVLEIRVTN